MRKVTDTEKLPIKMWPEDIEGSAFLQAKNLADLPFAFTWISLMPHSHSGYGMPAGGVMPTRGVVVPNGTYLLKGKNSRRVLFDKIHIVN